MLIPAARRCLRHALDVLVPMHAERRFLMERRDAKGRAEPVFTLFDHALLSVRLTELSGSPRFVNSVLGLADASAIATSRGLRWRFSPAVDDVPPDADTTGLVLLAADLASGYGDPSGAALRAATPIAGFAEGRSGGAVDTWFGRRVEPEIDPVVNLHVAELLLRVAPGSRLLVGVLEYLGAFLRHHDFASAPSAFYLDSSLLIEQVARLECRGPGRFDPAALRRVDEFVDGCEPTCPLQSARLALAAGLRGRVHAARRLRERVLEFRQPDGLWPFARFYVQRTPHYAYGSRLCTTLAAVLALRDDARVAP